MHKSPMWGVGAALLLGGVTPLVIVERNNSHVDALTLLLAGGLVMLAACQLGWILGTPKGEKFAAAMFWVFVYIFAGLATLVQIALDTYPFDNRIYPGDLVATALVHLWIGIIAYLVGGSLWTSLRRTVNANKDGSRQTRQPWQFSQPQTVVVALVGLTAVGWKVWGYGVSAFFVSRHQTTNILTGQGLNTLDPFYTMENKTSGFISIFLTQYLVFAALFVILYSRHHRLWERTRPRRIDVYLVPPLIVANLIVNNPIGSPRMWFFVVLVGFASIYVPVYRGANIRLYVVGALVLLLFAFTFLDAFRWTKGPAETGGSVTQKLATDPSYPVLQMHLNGMEYVRVHGYTWGEQLLGAVFGIVPRSLWADKPIATGQVVDRYLRSTSLWTEGYVDFGIPGIVMLFLIAGAAIAWLSNAARRATPGLLHATFPMLVMLQLYVLRGSLMPSLATVYQLMLAVALTVAWGQRMTKPATLPTVRSRTNAWSRNRSGSRP